VLPFVGINLMADTETASHIGDSMDDETVEVEGQVYAGIFRDLLAAGRVRRSGARTPSSGIPWEDAQGDPLLGARHLVQPGPVLTTKGLSLVKHQRAATMRASPTRRSSMHLTRSICEPTFSAPTRRSISRSPVGAPITEVILLGEAVNGNALAELEINPTTGEPLDPWE
jgi:hypothetical protein